MQRLRSANLWLESRRGLFFLLVGVLLAALLFLLDAPVGVDWEYTFSRVDEAWRDPYAGASFSNAPWTLLLVPHALLPLKLGNAINMALNILVMALVVRRFRGGWVGLLLVFVSPMFLDLMRTNNIDWIPLLSLLLPARWGLILMAVKPQALFGVAVYWIKEQGPAILLPVVAVTILSFVLLGFWPARAAAWFVTAPWNFAPFPWGLPLGAYLLIRAVKNDDEALAAVSTLFLTPYITPYSSTGLLAVAAGRYRKEAMIAFVAMWMYTLVELRRLAMC